MLELSSIGRHRSHCRYSVNLAFIHVLRISFWLKNCSRILCTTASSMNSGLDWSHILVRRPARQSARQPGVHRAAAEWNPHRWRPASRPVLLREAPSGPAPLPSPLPTQASWREGDAVVNVVRPSNDRGLRQATGTFRNSTRQREKPLEINGVHLLLIVLQLEVAGGNAFSPLHEEQVTSYALPHCPFDHERGVLKAPIHVHNQLEGFAQLMSITTWKLHGRTVITQRARAQTTA